VPEETMEQVDQATDVAPAQEVKKGDITTQRSLKFCE